MTNDKQQTSSGALPNFLGAALEYMVDAGQRSVLFMDVMRQRGSQYREHLAGRFHTSLITRRNW